MNVNVNAKIKRTFAVLDGLLLKFLIATSLKSPTNGLSKALRTFLNPVIFEAKSFVNPYMKKSGPRKTLINSSRNIIITKYVTKMYSMWE